MSTLKTIKDSDTLRVRVSYSNTVRDHEMTVGDFKEQIGSGGGSRKLLKRGVLTTTSEIVTLDSGYSPMGFDDAGFPDASEPFYFEFWEELGTKYLYLYGFILRTSGGGGSIFIDIDRSYGRVKKGQSFGLFYSENLGAAPYLNNFVTFDFEGEDKDTIVAGIPMLTNYLQQMTLKIELE